MSLTLKDNILPCGVELPRRDHKAPKRLARGTKEAQYKVGVLVSHDLPSDPSASPWDCAPGERTQCFSGGVGRGLWGLRRCVTEEVL